MSRVPQGLLCLVVLLGFTAGTAVALPQTKDQQKCITKINKDAIKVQAAQGKANAHCVKDYVKTGNGGDSCVLNDPKNKVEKKQDKLVADENKKCTMPLPTFGYTGGVFAGTTAYQAEVDLVHDVFGDPIDGPNGVQLCDPFANECLCQRQAIDRVEKLSRAISKIWVKCKKAALKEGKDPFTSGAADAGELAQCVTNGAIALSVENDTKGKIDKAKGQLLDTLTKFCGGPFVHEPFDGGVCAAPATLADLRDCLAERVACRFCLMVNAIDGMAIDCGAWSGTTCP